MFRSPTKAISNIILAVGMIAAIWTALGQTPTRADSPVLIDSWLEEPSLSSSYIWPLPETNDAQDNLYNVATNPPTDINVISYWGVPWEEGITGAGEIVSHQRQHTLLDNFVSPLPVILIE